MTRGLFPLPDYLAPDLDVIFVGINPGVQSARAGRYYANPRNPFWRLLHEAGLTPRELRPDEDHLLPTFGYGITDIVKRPSRGVADLSPTDFRQGRLILEEKLLTCQPQIVCFNGKTGFINFFGPGASNRLLKNPLRPGCSKRSGCKAAHPSFDGYPARCEAYLVRTSQRRESAGAPTEGGSPQTGLFQQPAKRFGRQAVMIGASRVFVVPSTSPANAGTPIFVKLRYFRALRQWREDLAHDRWLMAHS
jgi:TDG/mug DNA glycosylase family protein